MIYLVFWKDGKKEKVEANNKNEIEENSLHKKKNPGAEVDFSGNANAGNFSNFTYYPQEKKWWWD